jgi:hypothetical protein
MAQLYAELYHIDYKKLLSQIQEQKEMSVGAPLWLIEFLGKLLTSHVGFLLNIVIPRGKIAGFAEEYGVTFTKLIIKDVTLIKTKTGGSNMLNISASIDKVEWGKLLSVLGGPAKKPKVGDDTLQKVIKIVEPFIANTMDTIPNEAIAELFNLLARDKVMALARNYGVRLSGVSVKPG